MRASGRYTAVFMVLLIALPLSAQPEPPKVGTLVGEEKRTRDELAVADKLAADKRYDDAVRRYQQILAESGDALVSLAPGEPRRALPARWLVHQRIAAMPPEGRKLFRAAVEDTARKWLEQAAPKRDVRLLEQVVAEAFCTRPAEQALHLLGDLALERGEFEVAEHYWRMLARPASEVARKPGDGPETFALLHPDPEGDGALARAKLILALVFRGEKQSARLELEHFRKLHPAAQGELAGRKGKYADSLQHLLDSDTRWVPAVAAANSTWSTFGGDDARNRTLPAEARPYWDDSPTWQKFLPGDPKAKPHRDSDPPLGTGASARSLAFHPVIVPGYALVADAARVFVCRLADGEPVAEYDHRQNTDLPESLDLRVPSRMDACYTLTVAGDRIYARFGRQAVKAGEIGKQRELESAIVCLTLERGPDDKVKLQLRWQIRARPEKSDPDSMFEGTPLVRDGRLWVTRTRFDGRQMVASVECYDADAGAAKGESPPRRWRQEIWSVEVGTDATRHRHDLLTLAGPNIVYCTHSGAIVALDALTGRRAWAYRYPVATNRPPDGVLPRDLCPCVYADGRIYAAPADCDRILCLDARSGETNWESTPAHVVQLLGVSQGRLFVSRGGFPQGLCAYDGRNGKQLWIKPDAGDRATFGRGLISDRFIFWPTRLGLRVLRQEDGDPVDAGSGAVPWGNLAVGEGCLIVTTPTEIWGFVPLRQNANVWRKEVEESPASAEARYHLALAEADGGDWDRALADFRRAAELAGDGQYLHGRPLRELAHHRRFELLEMRAGQLWKREQKDEALAILRELSGEPYPLADRVRAWVMRRWAGERTVPDLIGDRRLRSLWLTRRDGIPLRADDFLAGVLDVDLQTELEKRALETLEKNLDATVERFPWPRAVREALLTEAGRLEKAAQPWEAAQRYRQVMYGARWESERARAEADRLASREGLIRIYEKAGYVEAARALRRRHQRDRGGTPGDRPSPEPPGLIRAPATPSLGMSQGVELAPFREWPLTPFRDAATGEEGPPSDEEGRGFFSGPHRVSCRSLATGRELWMRDLGHDATESAFFAETVIVAGPDGISRLRRDDGRLVWQFLAADPHRLPLLFPEAILPRLEPSPQPSLFSAFRLAGARLFFRYGRQRLTSLDVETGRVLWQASAPGAPIRSAEEGAAFNEHYLATADHVLLQTTGGEMIGLDAADGRTMHDPRPAPAMWPGPPILIDATHAVYCEGPRLRAIDLDTGFEQWLHTPRGQSSLSGAAPQMRRDGSHLLLVVERNYGYDLERLNLDGGKSDLGPIFLGRDRVDLARSAICPEIYALLAGDQIIAVDREEGRRRWTMALPGVIGEPWRVRATRSVLLAHPDRAFPLADIDRLVDRAARAVGDIPTLGRFQVAANMMYHGYFRRFFPVLAIAPADGKKVQESTFPAHGPRATLLLGDRAAVIVEGRMELMTSK